MVNWELRIPSLALTLTRRPQATKEPQKVGVRTPNMVALEAKELEVGFQAWSAETVAWAPAPQAVNIDVWNKGTEKKMGNERLTGKAWDL